MAGVTRNQSPLPHGFEKQRSTTSQEEGEGQKSSLFLCKRGLGEWSQTRSCAQTRVEDCPTLDRGCVCAQGASALTQDRSLVFSMAPPHSPPRPRGERAQWGCPASSFFPGTGALSIQGSGCGGLVMQGLLKTFQASSGGPGHRTVYKRKNRIHLSKTLRKEKGLRRDPAVKGFRIKTAGTYAHARPPSQAI